MADDIRVDKISLREKVKASLDHLNSQNYIGRNGDTYNFLTDEEQDIAREIKNTNVDTASIVAVSYTHLDVYKRQEQGRNKSGQAASQKEYFCMSCVSALRRMSASGYAL